MKVYVGVERIWSVPAWAPTIDIPAIIYRYSVDDLVDWMDTTPAKLSGSQSSSHLVKNHQVTRMVQSHNVKRRRPKGGASVRRS